MIRLSVRGVSKHTQAHVLLDKSVLDPASPPVAEDLEATRAKRAGRARQDPGVVGYRYRAPLNRFAVCGSRYSPPGSLLVLRPKPPKCEKEADVDADACEHAEREAKPDETQPGHALSRLSWSQAMRRTFKVDVLRCVCGGRREVIALIPSGEIATKILAHLRMLVTDAQFSSLTRPPLHRSKYSRAAGLSALRRGARTLVGRRGMTRSTGRSSKTTRRKRSGVGARGRVDWQMPAA